MTSRQPKSESLAQEVEAFSNQVETMFRQMETMRLTLAQSPPPSSALFDEMLSQMQVTGEELRVAQEELRQQQDELATAHAEIAAERERYRDLFENAPDGYVVTTIHGIIQEANRAAYDLLQNDHAQLIGKPLANRVVPEDRKSFRMLLNTLSRKEAALEIEVRLMQSNVSPIEAALTVTTMGGRDGKPTGLRWLIRDIGLRQEVARLQAERSFLDTENIRLHQSVYESSHRIKNHLQTLASTVDMQLGEGREFVPAEEFQRIGQQIYALAAIHDLLTLDTKAHGTTTHVPAQALLEKILTILDASTGASGVQFQLEDVMLTTKTAVSLALVTNELVSNAIKHSNNSPIEVTLAVREGAAHLEVCDNGPGFPPDFNAATSAHTGLELIGQLTRVDLRGQVHYENRSEGGARVRVVIPVSE